MGTVLPAVIVLRMRAHKLQGEVGDLAELGSSSKEDFSGSGFAADSLSVILLIAPQSEQRGMIAGTDWNDR